LDDVRETALATAVSDPFVPADDLPQLSVESQLLHVDGQHTRVMPETPTSPLSQNATPALGGSAMHPTSVGDWQGHARE
jgi:hypothetical protein